MRDAMTVRTVIKHLCCLLFAVLPLLICVYNRAHHHKQNTNMIYTALGNKSLHALLMSCFRPHPSMVWGPQMYSLESSTHSPVNIEHCFLVCGVCAWAPTFRNNHVDLTRSCHQHVRDHRKATSTVAKIRLL
jgi:hypothetical protein